MSLAHEIRTTHGTIALFNLDQEIERLEAQAASGGLEPRRWSALVDRVGLRGQVRGRIADYERATDLAERLVQAAPEEAVAFLARARARAALHRFPDALDDLDAAERLGSTGDEVEGERAVIFQAVGRYDEALARYRAAAAQRPGFETLAALASLAAERGEVSEAERLFDESRAHFRGVSPFGLAQLDFQRGHLWHGRDPARARMWYTAACTRLPDFARAEGHLAEIEAAQGELDAATTRLARLAVDADDPDFAAQLARILREAGRTADADGWRARAEARYEALMVRHPEAFADHAAAFWLMPGGDPRRALHFATLNAGLRPTPRARALLARATAMCEQGPVT